MAKLPPETRIRLRDGREMRIRPIVPEDAPRLREFHDRLSRNTTRLRFFSPLKHLSRDFANRLTSVDYERRCAFVVSPLDSPTIHAVGRYEGETKTSAELAFVVEDSFQGMGMGPLLLDRVVAQARKAGFTRLTAVTLCENDQMLGIFRESPYRPQIHIERDLAFVRFDISADPPRAGLASS